MTGTGTFLFAAMAMLVSSALHAQTATALASTALASSAATADANPSANASTSTTAKRKSTHAQNYRFSNTVLKAIYRDRSVGDVEIFVSGNAATGRVVLTGYINDPGQEQAAISAARQVAGVRQVTSRLRLQEHGNY